MKRALLLLGVVAGALLVASCGEDDVGRTSQLVEVDLTAEIVDWQVIDGEVVEVWGYNGEYPGPLIEAFVGDTIRVNLTNNLPEDTAIHWHGLAVPNDQDGVPGITQPPVRPGETWTYEFVVDEPGTTMYHTHANTVRQLGRGLVGPLIVHEIATPATPKYDREYTMVLHEIDGLYTINGHSFPSTLEDEETFLKIEEGQTILVRFINAGQQHHPMHLHGHQFQVVALDGSTLDNPIWVNTQDIAPGQTVDVVIHGDNPGTWTFHCHILPHVTNRGVYPGGMLTLLDYTDHQSFLEGGPAAPQPGDQPAITTTTTEASAAPAAAPSGGRIEMSASEFAFSPDALVLEPGTEVTIALRNDGAVEHNLEIPDLGVFVAAAPGVTEEVTFVVPNSPGIVQFLCNVAGHLEAGMVGTAVISG